LKAPATGPGRAPSRAGIAARRPANAPGDVGPAGRRRPGTPTAAIHDAAIARVKAAAPAGSGIAGFAGHRVPRGWAGPVASPEA
jgi:hypothetical protein